MSPLAFIFISFLSILPYEPQTLAFDVPDRTMDSSKERPQDVEQGKKPPLLSTDTAESDERPNIASNDDGASHREHVDPATKQLLLELLFEEVEDKFAPRFH